MAPDQVAVAEYAASTEHGLNTTLLYLSIADE